MLDIHLSLMLLVAVIFLVLLMLLNKWLYQPLLTFMDERDKSIRKDLENVSSNSAEIDEFKAKTEAVITQAKSEAAAMRAKTIEDSKLLAMSKIEAKKEELEQVYQGFLDELKKEEEQLKSELLSQMPLFKESLKAKFSQI
ncbi:FoF1 ATP synthase subunit B' [Hydrogenimonas sp.]|uniref:FoF1 ATP synthase subunit B' n=1 Tax=Hydrogenimonas sp. TaxID=2231112 RepID=UPI00262ABF1B|nr:FoF1 ATP synthase subunit B' [Hydrogenimonas sp.]